MFPRGGAQVLGLLLSCAWCVTSITFTLALGEKCLSDDLSKDALAIGDFGITPLNAAEATDSHVNIVVRDPDGLVHFQKDDIRGDGKFSFTTTVEGVHSVCFNNEGVEVERVSLDFRSGVDARDYTAMVKEEHLKPLDLELRRLDDIVENIHSEMLHQRSREVRFRDTNDSTGARVKWASFFSIVVLLSLGIWQVYHLQAFFKEKKLI